MIFASNRYIAIRPTSRKPPSTTNSISETKASVSRRLALTATLRGVVHYRPPQKKQECLSLFGAATATTGAGAKSDEQRGYTSQAMFRAEGTPKRAALWNPAQRTPSLGTGP